MNIIDTMTQETQAPVILRGRCWGPNTLNNWTELEYSELRDYLQMNCEDFVLQKEVGLNGTPHLQYGMKYKNARTFKAIKKKMPRAHLELAKNWNAVKNYCSKTETRIGDTDVKQHRKVKNPLNGKVLRLWQQELLDMLDSEPDDRTINWVVDIEGNAGKTSLAKSLCIKYPNGVLYMGGKSADIKYGVFKFLQNEKNDLKICIFDFTRSIEGYVSYEAIESIKNGIFFNTKYESEMCLFDPPHIVIFSNWEPELNKLSLDRWNVITL
jgi:hypothetical protein